LPERGGGASTTQRFGLARVHALQQRTLALLGVCVAGLIVLFVIDLVTPNDVVIAGLYVLPILLAAAVLPTRGAAAVWLFAVTLQFVALLVQRASLFTSSAEAVAVTSTFLIVLLLRSARSGKGDFNHRLSIESAARVSIAPYLDDGPAALTKREREVADRAASGQSAKEIAQQLSIGRRTVETHLAHAYAKLGVGSKVALILERERLLGAIKEKSNSSG
jgi:DNA-binding CsgD family transcriptional regulator